MSSVDLIEILDKEWDENGFFENLRYNNVFNSEIGEEVLKKLKCFNIKEEEEMIFRRLVSLLWYIPQFMEWQKERLSKEYDEESMKKYNRMINHFSNEVERILGVP